MASYDLSDSDYNLVSEGLDVLLDRTQRARRKAQNLLSKARTPQGRRGVTKEIKKLERKEDDIKSVSERLGKTLSRDMADWY